MFIIYGTRRGEAEIGDMGLKRCDECDRETPFTALVQYTYFHIWYLFSFLTGRDYYLRCTGCGSMLSTDAATVRERHAGDNIPFLHRNGALLVLCLISAVIFAMTLKEKSDGRRADEYIASPQANDLYTADLSAVPDSGFGVENLGLGPGKRAYGTMRLLRVEGDRYYFASSSKAFERLSDLNKRRDLEYDMETVFALTAGEVRELRRSGVILDVKRQ